MTANHEYQQILDLDLDPIKVKLMHAESGEGWSLARVNATEREYKRFLILMKKFPKEPTSPIVDVDTFWHYHILDTMKYASDCQHVFGYFLHHFPYIGMRGKEDEATLARMGERMGEVYEQTFGESYAGAAASLSEAAYCASAPEAAYCAAGASAAYCAAKPEAAYCAAGASAAYCAAKPEAAYCAAGASAAYCAAKPEAAYCAAGASAAYCAAKPEAAYCAAGVRAAYCAAGASAAYCAAKPAGADCAAQPTAAYCAAGAGTVHQGATPEAAYCAAGSTAQAREAASTTFAGLWQTMSSEQVTRLYSERPALLAA